MNEERESPEQPVHIREVLKTEDEEGNMNSQTLIKILISAMVAMLALSLPYASIGQKFPDGDLPYIPLLRRQLSPAEIFRPKSIHKKAGHFTADDWARVIDETWGEGLSTARKLEIFDRAWNEIDRRYGAFMNLGVNIDSLRNAYRPEIAAGVSRGRFAAVMNHFSLALKDAHTFIADVPVNWGTRAAPGVPLFVISTARANDHFGACLTPLPDSSLLVYRSLPNHVLGLAPGDLVLGYEGIPWKELYEQLLEAQLPILLTYVWGSTDHSMTHIMLQSAGMNWHLFDTIDIVKYSTGDTIHLSTSLLVNQRGNIWGNEQLDVPGVPMPDFWTEDYITWGIVEGTRIGYIYVASWHWDARYQISQQFYEAIEALMHGYPTSGLIIDFRLNYGGTMEMAHSGYSLLFDTTLTKVSFDKRGDPNDHFDMVPHPTHTANRFVIRGDPVTFYDKPIAVLTGPNAVSNGDWESLRMKFHPMVRTFGKSTNGAFTPSDEPNLGHPDWYFTKANGSGYLIDGHKYLAHTGVEIDEEVWLTRDGVAQGKDTVVEAAIAWINASSEADSGPLPTTIILRDNYPNPFNAGTKIEYELPNPSRVSLKVYNTQGQLVGSLLDDDFEPAGIHSVSWDGTDNNGKPVRSGVYFYQLTMQGYGGKAKKMLLLR